MAGSTSQAFKDVSRFFLRHDGVRIVEYYIDFSQPDAPSSPA